MNCLWILSFDSTTRQEFSGIFADTVAKLMASDPLFEKIVSNFFYIKLIFDLTFPCELLNLVEFDWLK